MDDKPQSVQDQEKILYLCTDFTGLELHATTNTEIQQQDQGCQTHIGKMSQIISQLSQRGLPETKDDHYFMEELDDLVESIRRWASLFSRGQPPLSIKDFKNTRVTTRVRDHLVSGFLDIALLLKVKNVGEKVRTRFTEATILRTLMGDRLLRRPIGFLESDYENHRNLIQMMDCTGKPHYSNYLYSCLIFFGNILEQEIQAWSALTIYYLTKDNHNFQIKKEKEIETITDTILHDLSSFNGSPRATRERLRDIVSDVADLGLEIAKHPFEFRSVSDLDPGGPFVANMMKDVDQEEGVISETTTIILCYPLVKVKYDEMGKSTNPSTYLSKARVSCIH